MTNEWQKMPVDLVCGELISVLVPDLINPVICRVNEDGIPISVSDRSVILDDGVMVYRLDAPQSVRKTLKLMESFGSRDTEIALTLQDQGAKFEFRKLNTLRWLRTLRRLDFDNEDFQYRIVSLPPSIEPGEEFGPEKFDIADRMQNQGAIFERSYKGEKWQCPKSGCSFIPPSDYKYRRKNESSPVEPSIPDHPFVVGRKYFNVRGDELLCVSVDSGESYINTKQPICMMRVCDQENTQYTVEGWFGGDADEFRADNIDMNRLHDSDDWITDRLPAPEDTCEEASDCVEVTYKNGLLGWEQRGSFRWNERIVAWRKIRPAYKAE